MLTARACAQGDRSDQVAVKMPNLHLRLLLVCASDMMSVTGFPARLTCVQLLWWWTGQRRGQRSRSTPRNATGILEFGPDLGGEAD
jgi:hypothetical protein